MGIGNYGGTLMYASLCIDKDLKERNEEVVIDVNIKQFQTYAVHINNDVQDSDERIHYTWIAPEMLNSPLYVNDLWYY